MTEIENLKTYKYLSSDKKNHLKLLNEKKIILYAAMLLESENNTTISLSLDVLDNFVSNEETHYILLSTFGIYEALESLSIRMRNKNFEIYHRSIDITEILRNSAPPALNTRSRKRGIAKRHQLYSLYLMNLTKNDSAILEQILLKIKGIISFVLDVEMRRCTIRICSKITINEVIEKLHIKLNMKAFVVTRNVQTGEEEYKDIMNNTINRSYLEYPEDETLSPKGKAVIETARLVKNSNNIIESVLNLWNEAFYW
ncbi:unnamed protein product [Phaedon cochleariae]|uniref:Uncharacterized protein n=1 Tax=Phaedon cochleariae TaxID=80249 RepID=A0A9N9SG57_PHACE|nr:unnamed protein product [Phaedon cochleariae]